MRVGNCSGFYGDRLSAMREMLEGGPLDYLTGDYLAELTMLILGKDKIKDPDTGYAKTFVRQLTDCLHLARARGVRVVANAGGLNPAALAARIRELDPTVRVAHVEGDDLLSGAHPGPAASGVTDRGPGPSAGRDSVVGGTGPDRGSPDELAWKGALTANAYLGAFGIAEALRAGAEVVVTGRVTDASLTLGPAIAEFGWGRDDFDRLAAGVVVGHVLECGAQATGGNFAGFAGIDHSRPLGFPLAEIAEDGTAVVTRHPGTGGAVTVDTVTAQLVYEVGPARYLNPDVTARLDTVRLDQAGDDRVRISGVRGEPPPATTKIALNHLGGYRNTIEFVLTGLDVEEKAAWVRAQLEQRLSRRPPAELTWELSRTDRPDPATEAEASALLRCHAKDPDPAVAGRAFTGAAVELALASYPGFHVTAPPSEATAFGVYRAAYLPQADVPHVAVLHDGRRVPIAPPPTVQDVAVQDVAARAGAGAREAEAPWSGRIVRMPLGRLVFARSGDKGGTANIGVWIPADHPRRADAYGWLRAWLDAGEVRRLLPEAAGLDIAVHPLPHLAALNIVVDGLLGEGVAASTRFDPQAKAVGEWLRARHADIPEELIR